MDETGRLKRATISIRTSDENKRSLAAAADLNSRSLNQEIEFRLEVSLLLDREAGSLEARTLADFTRLATTLIEAQTGKPWTKDADTYFRVRKAINAFTYAHHPNERPAYSSELEAALAEVNQADAALQGDPQFKPINALLGKPMKPESEEALEKQLVALRRLHEAHTRYKAATEANDAAALGVASDLGQLFPLGKLRSRTGERNDTGATAALQDAL